MLRLFVVFGYSLNTNDGSSAIGGQGAMGGGGKKRKGKGNQQQGQGSNTSGSNALLRQLLKVSTTLLLVTPIQLSSSSSLSSSSLNSNSGNTPSNNYGISTKDIGKLLSSTILQMTNDIRPKVRKAAWGCLMEIIFASSSSSGGSVLGGDMNSGMDGMQNERVDKSSSSIMEQRVQSQRQVIADYIWEYCHAILTNYTSSSNNNKKDNKEDGTNNKIVHILRFLVNGSTIC